MFFRLKYNQGKRNQFEKALVKVGSIEEKSFYKASKKLRCKSFIWVAVITLTVWLISSLKMMKVISHAQVKITPLAAFIYPSVIQISFITFLFATAACFIPLRVILGKNKETIDAINQKVCERQEDVLEEVLNKDESLDECEVAFVYLNEWGSISYLEYELE